MYKDEIVDELRKEREAYAARFNFDVHKILKDLLRREKARKGVKKIELSPRTMHKHRLHAV